MNTHTPQCQIGPVCRTRCCRSVVPKTVSYEQIAWLLLIKSRNESSEPAGSSLGGVGVYSKNLRHI